MAMRHISRAESNSKLLNGGDERGHEMVYSLQKISTAAHLGLPDLAGQKENQELFGGSVKNNNLLYE